MCKSEGIRIVSPPICEQIAVARAALEESPKFDLLRQHQTYHFLHQEAGKHSVDMELPNGQRVRSGRAKKIAERALLSAREYFSRNYDGDLNSNLIMDTSFLVSGERFYRPGGITFTPGGHVYPSDVPKEMDSFLEEQKNVCTRVGKALHSHFHLARVHPFKDGNGRLARLVQNEILEKEGLPPIIIEPFERGMYIDLLREAQDSYKENREVKPEQVRCYNYLAMKIVASLMGAKKIIDSREI